MPVSSLQLFDQLIGNPQKTLGHSTSQKTQRIQEIFTVCLSRDLKHKKQMN